MYLKDLQVNNANSNNFPWASPLRKQSHFNERQMTVRVPTEKQEVSCKSKEIKRPLANCKKRENHKVAGHNLGLDIDLSSLKSAQI